MNKKLTKEYIIVLSIIFILSSCGGSINSENIEKDIAPDKGVTTVEESFNLKAKGGETENVEGNSSGEAVSSEEPIIN